MIPPSLLPFSFSGSLGLDKRQDLLPRPLLDASHITLDGLPELAPAHGRPCSMRSAPFLSLSQPRHFSFDPPHFFPRTTRQQPPATPSRCSSRSTPIRACTCTSRRRSRRNRRSSRRSSTPGSRASAAPLRVASRQRQPSPSRARASATPQRAPPAVGGVWRQRHSAHVSQPKLYRYAPHLLGRLSLYAISHVGGTGCQGCSNANSDADCCDAQ